MTIYLSTRRSSISDLLKIVFKPDEFVKGRPPSGAQREVFKETRRYNMSMDMITGRNTRLRYMDGR